MASCRCRRESEEEVKSRKPEINSRNGQKKKAGVENISTVGPGLLSRRLTSTDLTTVVVCVHTWKLYRSILSLLRETRKTASRDREGTCGVKRAHEPSYISRLLIGPITFFRLGCVVGKEMCNKHLM